MELDTKYCALDGPVYEFAPIGRSMLLFAVETWNYRALCTDPGVDGWMLIPWQICLRAAVRDSDPAGRRDFGPGKGIPNEVLLEDLTVRYRLHEHLTKDSRLGLRPSLPEPGSVQCTDSMSASTIRYRQDWT